MVVKAAAVEGQEGWVGLRRGGMENGLQLVRVNREDRRQERRELGVERRWQFRSLPEGRNCSPAGRAAAPVVPSSSQDVAGFVS